MTHFTRPLEKLLSVDEKSRRERFLNEKARQEFVLSHGVLHCMLAKLLRRSLASFEFKAGAQGKPQLAGREQSQALSFNLTHTENACLIAFGRNCEVGIDAEKNQAMLDVKRLARTYLSLEEYSAWIKMPAERQNAQFLDFWCAKEALLKAAGCGLAIHPSQVNTLEAISSGTLRGMRENGCFFEFRECSLRKLPLPAETCGWLAVFGAAREARLYRLEPQLLADMLSLEG
jgi:Phosphopantetheinyl transferase